MACSHVFHHHCISDYGTHNGGRDYLDVPCPVCKCVSSELLTRNNGAGSSSGHPRSTGPIVLDGSNDEEVHDLDGESITEADLLGSGNDEGADVADSDVHDGAADAADGESGAGAAAAADGESAVAAADAVAPDERAATAKAKSKAAPKAVAPKMAAKAKAKAKATAGAGVAADAVVQDASAAKAKAKSNATAAVPGGAAKAKAKAKAKAAAAVGGGESADAAADESAAGAAAEGDESAAPAGDGESAAAAAVVPVDCAEADALAVMHSENLSGLFNGKVMCMNCKQWSCFKSSRSINMAKSTWRCGSCSTKYTQLRRLYNTWPTQNFRMLSEDAKFLTIVGNFGV